MAADDRDGILEDVDGDADSQLLAGEAALPDLPEALGEVGVVDVSLVHPDSAAQHDSVPVAGYRGEHAVPPLEGRLVGDAARLGRALDGDVVAQELDEGDQGGKRLAAASLANGLSEWQELVASVSRHEPPEGIRSSHMDLSNPPERPPGGIAAKQRSGRCSGKFSAWFGRT